MDHRDETWDYMTEREAKDLFMIVKLAGLIDGPSIAAKRDNVTGLQVPVALVDHRGFRIE